MIFAVASIDQIPANGRRAYDLVFVDEVLGF
jgi:hypothetical protein